MQYKKALLVFCLLICILFSVSTAVASDINDDTMDAVVSAGIEDEQMDSDEIGSSQSGVADDSTSAGSDKAASSLNQTALSSSKSYDVSQFSELKSALSSSQYDTVTVNLKSNIKLKDTFDLGSSISTLTINGNGKTIDGYGGDCRHPFLRILNGAEITIKNVRIINCEASYGAAIYNLGGGRLTVVNSVFENNTVLNYGGAIFNSANDSIVKDCTFKNNRACKDLDSSGVNVFGGAIYNNAENMTITGCTFESNAAETYGSGLNYSDKEVFGGAIYNVGNGVKITGNVFCRNSAGEASAIYNYGDDVLIDSNTFKLNKALSSRKDDAIVYMVRDGYFLEVDKSFNTFITDTKCYSTILNHFGLNVVITNNKFDDRLNTAIKAPSSVIYANYLIITLRDENGKAVSGAEVTVKIKTATTLKTNKKGQIKASTSDLAPKSYTVKITFKGSSKYVPSSKSLKVTVKKATPKVAAKSKAFKKTKKVKKYAIKLKTNRNKIMKNRKVTLKIKGKKAITAKTNNKGVATFKIKMTKKGIFKSTVTYKGDKYYKKVSKTVKIKIK